MSLLPNRRPTATPLSPRSPYVAHLFLSHASPSPVYPLEQKRERRETLSRRFCRGEQPSLQFSFLQIFTSLSLANSPIRLPDRASTSSNLLRTKKKGIRSLHQPRRWPTRPRPSFVLCLPSLQRRSCLPLPLVLLRQAQCQRRCPNIPLSLTLNPSVLKCLLEK